MARENQLSRALAESTAHGVSRLVGPRRTYVKVTWFLLFIGFLALFTKNAVTFVQKLIRKDVAKFLEPDSVHFEWPDLYLCPENPISGSYPLTLSPAEVAEIEKFKKRAERLFHSAYEHNKKLSQTDSFYVLNILHSMPYQLLSDWLAHRTEQFTVGAYIRSDYGSFRINMTKFYHPQFINCFTVQLTQSERKKLSSDDFVMYLFIMLDPYFSHFHPDDHPISTIRSREKINTTYDVFEWNPVTGYSVEKTNAVNLIVASPNNYPTMGSTNFMLAPGRGYQVKLEMDERDYSPELAGQMCIRDPERVSYFNPYTGGNYSFEYTGDYCYYQEVARRMYKLYNCSLPKFPKPWSFKHVPSCYNLSAGQRFIDPGFDTRDQVTKNSGIFASAKQACRNKRRCKTHHYSRSYSFGNWPSYGSAARFVNTFLRNHYDVQVGRNGYKLPGWKFLLDMAESLTVNESVHQESLFRAYLSESMLKVVIRAESPMSPRIMMAPAYSFTSLLADTGGLLGFYIGCSMLTLCELVELLHNVCTDALRARHQRKEQRPSSVRPDRQQKSEVYAVVDAFES